jgi:hypothetical protein
MAYPQSRLEALGAKTPGPEDPEEEEAEAKEAEGEVDDPKEGDVHCNFTDFRFYYDISFVHRK